MPRAESSGAIERAPDSERLLDDSRRCSGSHHHVHLIRLPSKDDIRCGTAPVETLEARPTHPNKLRERLATFSGAARAAVAQRRPTNHDDHRSRIRNPVSGDLADTQLRSDAGCSDDKQRLGIDDRAGSRGRHARPAARDRQPDAMRRHDAGSLRSNGRRGRDQREHQQNRQHERAHLSRYTSMLAAEVPSLGF